MTENSHLCLSVKKFGKHLFRRKPIDDKNSQTTGDLSRCLTTFDLTNLGIGSILGAGIFVVVGQVASTIAGPSVIISLALAACTSLLSGICYAEFGSRVPRTTGSAYSYSYHTVGEFVAFIIGWNLVLEYMIGTAADARALSGAIDYLLDHRISNFSITHMGFVPLTGATPDLLGFLLTVTVTLVLASGVKESARYTVVFNVLTGFVAIFIIIMGATKSDFKNWNSTAKFFPTGAHGVLSGAATCFYAYVGYDIIATTGEEAKQPSRSIPLAMALTLIVCFLAYVGVATVLTLMLPYGALLHSNSPITEAFYIRSKGTQSVTQWIVGLGAVAGLSASLMGSEFPLPRIIYAMSSDGLLFRFLSRVWSQTEVPIYATIIPGFLTAFFTMLFDLAELVEMMSIGTLLAYSLVCTSVLLLRYKPLTPPTSFISDSSFDEDDVDINFTDHKMTNLGKGDMSTEDDVDFKGKSVAIQMHRQYKKIVIVICLIWLLSVALALTTQFGERSLMSGDIFVIITCITILLGIIVATIWLSIQTEDKETVDQLHFKVPLVPWLPVAAVLFNIILMLRLSPLTWIRFSVWLGIGFLLYFGYGFRHSVLRGNNKYQPLSQNNKDNQMNDVDDESEEAKRDHEKSDVGDRIIYYERGDCPISINDSDSFQSINNTKSSI